MSNNSSASQAAALAAFRSRSVDPSNNDQSNNDNIAKRVYTRPPGPSATNSMYAGQAPKLSLHKIKTQEHGKKDRGYLSPATPRTHLSEGSGSQRTPPARRFDSNASIKDTPNRNSTMRDYFSLASSVNSHGDSSIHSVTTPSSDSIYRVRQSISSKAVPYDLSQKRPSQVSVPQDMIKNIKESINSKKIATGTSETKEKNQALLDGIRDSINLKKITTPYERPMESPDTEEDFLTLSAVRSHSGSPQINDDNESYVSLIQVLECSSNPETPKIVVHQELPDVHSIEHRPAYTDRSIFNDNYHYDTSFDDDTVSSRNSPGSMKFVKLQSPKFLVSLSSLNKSLEYGSKESLSRFRSPSQLERPSLDTNSSELTAKSKAKRKPPPDDVNVKSASTTHIPYEILSTENSDQKYKVLSSDNVVSIATRRNGSSDSGRSTQSKLPQFPNFENRKQMTNKAQDKKSKVFRHTFREKLKNASSFLDPDSDMEFHLEIDPLDKPTSRPHTPVANPQPIQLKTTMRTTSKRKEKKLQFNENKPWKNHNGLDYITESERKRYEGVWSSNRGLYMNCSVTPYKGITVNRVEHLKKHLQHDMAAVAASLSSSAKDSSSFYSENVQRFHNLDEASLDQLIQGVVVKRIWQRSRLPNETLESIWNLVDFRHDGTLNKPEFLVGMWLVDQSLYGRKLPKKVDDIVWDSLGSIGINIVIKKRGKR